MPKEVTTIQARGVLALPADLRRRHGLEPGSQVEVTERDDGVIELRPVIVVPASQAWFWTERWQKMEREADRDVERGRVTTFANADELFEHLDEADREP
jgi:AbrB family looped-hinge helix DNA binding protein